MKRLLILTIGLLATAGNVLKADLDTELNNLLHNMAAVRLAAFNKPFEGDDATNSPLITQTMRWFELRANDGKQPTIVGLKPEVSAEQAAKTLNSFASVFQEVNTALRNTDYATLLALLANDTTIKSDIAQKHRLSSQFIASMLALLASRSENLALVTELNTVLSEIAQQARAKLAQANALLAANAENTDAQKQKDAAERVLNAQVLNISDSGIAMAKKLMNAVFPGVSAEITHISGVKVNSVEFLRAIATLAAKLSSDAQMLLDSIRTEQKSTMHQMPITAQAPTSSSTLY